MQSLIVYTTLKPSSSLDSRHIHIQATPLMLISLLISSILSFKSTRLRTDNFFVRMSNLIFELSKSTIPSHNSRLGSMHQCLVQCPKLSRDITQSTSNINSQITALISLLITNKKSIPPETFTSQVVSQPFLYQYSKLKSEIQNSRISVFIFELVTQRKLQRLHHHDYCYNLPNPLTSFPSWMYQLHGQHSEFLNLGPYFQAYNKNKVLLPF